MNFDMSENMLKEKYLMIYVFGRRSDACEGHDKGRRLTWPPARILQSMKSRQRKRLFSLDVHGTWDNYLPWFEVESTSVRRCGDQ